MSDRTSRRTRSRKKCAGQSKHGQLARDGAGIALLDRICVQALDLRGLALRPLEPERWILFGYVHQARHPPNAQAVAFLDCMRETLAAFMQASEDNRRAVVMAG